MPWFRVKIKCLSATDKLSGYLSVYAMDANEARARIDQHAEHLLAIFNECEVSKAR